MTSRQQLWRKGADDAANTYRGFIDAIEDSFPNYEDDCLIFADWLEDQNRLEEAAAVRAVGSGERVFVIDNDRYTSNSSGGDIRYEGGLRDNLELDKCVRQIIEWAALKSESGLYRSDEHELTSGRLEWRELVLSYRQPSVDLPAILEDILTAIIGY